MDEYNLIVEELIERVENGELTLEQAELVNDYAYELYTTEGANLDARREFKTASKDIKTKLQMAKREYKAGNYKKATHLADEVIEDTKKLSDASGVGSAVIGWFASELLVSLKSMALCLPTLGIGSTIVGIKNLIDIVEDIIKAINAAEMGELDPGKLNKYINQLKRATREMRKAAIRVKATINAKSK